MSLTEIQIVECVDDEALFELLSAELQRRLPDGEGDDLEAFLKTIRAMPVGLRAMAAMYQLDVSLALDDLGWHFCNWLYRPYCEETAWALHELEAFEAAEIFGEALQVSLPWWPKLMALRNVSFDAFVKWYPDSDYEKATMPCTRRMWALCRGSDGKFAGLLKLWAPYARKYPHKVLQVMS
jgi:hypothetical protein